VDGGCLGAGDIEEEAEEADADVEDFARDFVLVDLLVVRTVVSLRIWEDGRTNERHSWWMGIKPSGLGLLLISLQ
jgi:hypothetical protein